MGEKWALIHVKREITGSGRFGFFLSLLLRLVFLLYQIVDQAVTISYMGVGYGDALNDLEILMQLTPHISRPLSQSDLVCLLRKNSPDAFVTSNKERVGISFLRFIFDEDGNLIEVTRRKLLSIKTKGR